MVQVDGLGNFQVRRNGVWQPFYDVGIYRGGTSNTVQDYSNQGFNTLETNQFSLSLLEQAKDAVSTYNPDGMMSVVDIEQYIDPRFSLYGNLADLEQKLSALESSPLIDRVFCFYWDNEQYASYDVAKSVIASVKQYDVDAFGGRRHPILMHNANQGTDRAYTGLVDVVGDYIRDPQTASYLGPSQSIVERATVLRNVEGQTAPFTVGVISEEEYAVNLRRLVYEDLIAGGHGFAYFRDGAAYQYNGNLDSPAATNVALRNCWPEFPKLRGEIDQLMPLLATPVGTPWQANPSSPSLVYGTRDYNGEGYLILVNPTNAPLTVQFTLSGLNYTPSAVTDYFTGAPIIAVSGSSFTITLQANQTAVYHLATFAPPAGASIPSNLLFSDGLGGQSSLDEPNALPSSALATSAGTLPDGGAGGAPNSPTILSTSPPSAPVDATGSATIQPALSPLSLLELDP